LGTYPRIGWDRLWQRNEGGGKKQRGEKIIGYQRWIGSQNAYGGGTKEVRGRNAVKGSVAKYDGVLNEGKLIFLKLKWRRIHNDLQ